jgi:hypothetical protein
MTLVKDGESLDPKPMRVSLDPKTMLISDDVQRPGESRPS